jgi:hypothetical protein
VQKALSAHVVVVKVSERGGYVAQIGRHIYPCCLFPPIRILFLREIDHVVIPFEVKTSGKLFCLSNIQIVQLSLTLFVVCFGTIFRIFADLVVYVNAVIVSINM